MAQNTPPTANSPTLMIAVIVAVVALLLLVFVVGALWMRAQSKKKTFHQNDKYAAEANSDNASLTMQSASTSDQTCESSFFYHRVTFIVSLDDKIQFDNQYQVGELKI